MSESNDPANVGGQGDENILDDLMQNNIEFDEEVEKPLKSDDKESDEEGNDNSKKEDKKDNHSDISEDDSADSESSDNDDEDADKKSKSSPKDENSSKRKSSNSPSKKDLEENHSDISEDEDENFGKDKSGNDSNETKEKKEPSNLKRSRERDDSDGSDKDSDEEGSKRKKPTLASRISKPPPPQSQSSPSPKRKKGKSYDYATKLNYLFRDARFFLVKSSVSENVTLSKVRGVWSTPPANEIRFNKAYKESRNVLLLFSVKESGKFCGLARLATESRRDVPRVPWILPPGLSASALGGVFKIDWICKKDLTFQKVQHLHNPWNENKPVKIGRDGQEIEPSIAEELCRLFPVDNEIDMTPILRRSKESARRQRSRPESEKVQDIPHTRPLADRIRPNPAQDNTRKRPHDRIGRGGGGHRDHFNAPRSKFNRKSSPPGSSRRDQNRDRGGNRNRLPSYEEYIRSVTRGSNNSRSSGRGRSSHRDDDYYDRRGNGGRPSYERSVESFLRRTGEVRRYRK